MKKYENLLDLKTNDKITILAFSDFGMIYQLHAKVVKYETKAWAQYEHALFMTLIPKGKRKSRTYVYHENKDCVIFKDYIETSYTPESVDMGGYKQTVYEFCDRNLFNRAIQSASSEPIYKNIRE